MNRKLKTFLEFLAGMAACALLLGLAVLAMFAL